MNYRVVEKNNRKYIDCFAAASPIQNDRGALELIALCGENRTDLLMINAEALASDFFDLKTGVAGQILQKLVNYHIKTAFVIIDEMRIKGRFKEMINESSRGNNFRAFVSHAAAEKWILSQS
ncbi:MAG: DUF4180 domain-containing protein [Syntrophomonadaceae bacterium]|nr:DUF4180 domain-containing protein [Syntrophomonadaceae bacterium]